MLFKCKMCGGDVIAQDDVAFGTCDSCGVTSTLPKANEERIVNLFNRANHLRRHHEFDKALSAYESILTEDSTNAEAHWCMVLCRYGIEYVEDPKTFERIPTCHRTQAASVLTDADYLSALENAPDSYTKELYEDAATRIHEIQKDILAISANEEPYDVFICYKETTDGDTRTKDSTLAQDIYYHLTNDGLRVFFARITLEDKIGRKYEPYIYNALNTAKVMLVIGTKKEYFEAVWVKNEWSRFLALMKNDRSRLLIPCYRDMDAYNIPEELSLFQAQDMGKIGFSQDLVRGIKKVVPPTETQATTTVVAPVASAPSANVDVLLKRAAIFLEDGDFTQADQYYERVLDINPECAAAYIGKLCIEFKLKSENELQNITTSFTEHSNFQKALRFADKKYRETIEGYSLIVLDRIKEQNRIEEERKQEVARIAEEKRLREAQLADKKRQELEMLAEEAKQKLLAEAEQVRIEREAMEDTYQKRRRTSRMFYVIYAIAFLPLALLSPQVTLLIGLFVFLVDTAGYYVVYTRREKLPEVSIAACVILGIRAAVLLFSPMVLATAALAVATFVAFRNPSLKLPSSISEELKFVAKENFQTSIELKETIASSKLAGKAKGIINDVKARAKK